MSSMILRTKEYDSITAGKKPTLNSPLRQIRKNFIGNLTRKGNSNVVARGPISYSGSYSRLIRQSIIFSLHLNSQSLFSRYNWASKQKQDISVLVIFGGKKNKTKVLTVSSSNPSIFKPYWPPTRLPPPTSPPLPIRRRGVRGLPAAAASKQARTQGYIKNHTTPSQNQWQTKRIAKTNIKKPD